ncbi:dethiobiotin synthase [Legionella spiritensis]|uniref:dethiobiotin synthase n=1 Tax=Legionella spiritensis TaxID=452 RepID=UPI000F6EE7A5|nr:dethiobiotin synthase [Legionella spiritensis]VEG90107.1 Dethiobiotin synthetase [Legionella spiritensis]
MKRFFITGTDTDCGKTYATCSLLDTLNQRQNKAIGLKPVATGCVEQNGQLYSEDALLIQENNLNQTLNINKWSFKPPVSPHIAAKEAGTLITTGDIIRFCNSEPFQNNDIMLIEGAGGLLVPFNEEETWIDFLRQTAIPVIVVVGMRLGCINHALMTAEVLRANQIECAGWIANCLDKNMLYLKENLSIITTKMNMPRLATIPYKGKVTGLSEQSMLQAC